MGAFRRLSRLLCALLLLMQAGVGAAHGLHALGGPPGMLAEICTLEGQRLLLLDAEGQPIEAPDGAPAGVCPVCAGLPGIALPAPPSLWVPVVFALPAAPQAAMAPLPPGGARAPPYSPRDPPVPA